MESSLPLPTELRSLLATHANLQQSLAENHDLIARLSSLLQARAVGHNRMDLPVDLGMGFSVEGVIEDTRTIICSIGLQDIWVELELENAVSFLGKRIAILDKRTAALEEPIKKLRDDYALVAKTLRDALQLPDETDPAP